jgi:DNA-binding response OmpR family regulator
MNSNNRNVKSKRILLVDNETDLTSLFRLVLEDHGFVVMCIMILY